MCVFGWICAYLSYQPLSLLQVSPQTSRPGPLTAPWLMACLSFYTVRPQGHRDLQSHGRKVSLQSVISLRERYPSVSRTFGHQCFYGSLGMSAKSSVQSTLFWWAGDRLVGLIVIFISLSLYLPCVSPSLHLCTAERVLASGSVQLPRFTLLESGSLLISPSHLSDAGSYTCMASNSRGIDEASSDLVVWGECMARRLTQSD